MRQWISTALLVGASAAWCAGCGDSDGSQTIMQVDTPDGGGPLNLCAGISDPCGDEGALRCEGDGVRECLDSGGGCLAWGFVSSCALGQTCAAGVCESTCTGQVCTEVGAKRCGVADAGEILTCDDHDGDGCLEWGGSRQCDSGLVCNAGGVCEPTCADACAAGAQKCEGAGVVTCGDPDSDGCTEWDLPNVCPEGFCAAGKCASGCVDDCGAAGLRSCEGSGTKVCEMGSDGCLVWSAVAACPGGTSCSLGACTAGCANECAAQGATQCDGGGVSNCGEFDGDACREWSLPQPCPEGTTCSAGSCGAMCQNECTSVGARSCDDIGQSVRECGQHDGDSCLEWAVIAQCAGDETCSLGACSKTCVDECVPDEKRCRPGSATTVERCRNADADSCVEWAPDVDCAASNTVCSGGACASSCVFDCQTSGQMACDGNIAKTCGNFDADPCLDWGTSVPCAAFEMCQQGACVQAAAPFAAVVSEVLYNAPGQDTDVFIEITGPASGDLAGFSLVAINGADGDEYATIVLSGTLDTGGRFVVAHPLASPWIADMADLTTPLADLQNGPDNLQLRYGDLVVDALGYGAFENGDTFAGEGAPAAEVAIGVAQTRDGDATDTNDNSVDFRGALVPTPGGAAVVAIPPDAAGDVVISEVMANPDAVDDDVGEWFELYNPYSDVAFELMGCSLSKTGNGGHVIVASLLVPPEGVAVLARSEDAGVDADYVFSGVNLTNQNGGLTLKCGTITVDTVTWVSAPEGASLSLDAAHLDAAANDDPSNWCLGQSNYNGGDLGSPGALNPPCPAAGTYDQTLHATTWGVCNPTANWNPITFSGTQVAASDATLTLEWWAPYCDGFDASELLVEVFTSSGWTQVGSALATGLASSCTWLDAGVTVSAATLNAARDPSGAVQARFRVDAGCPTGVGCGGQPYSCARSLRLMYTH